MRKTLLVLAVLSLSVLVLLAGCVSKPVGTNGAGSTGGLLKKQCEKQEEYTVQVPYNDTEFYYIEEGVGRPFCEMVPYTNFDLKDENLGNMCRITVNNKGNVSDDWTLRVKFINTASGGGPVSDPVTKYVGEGQTVVFEFPYSGTDRIIGCDHNRVGVSQEIPQVETCKYSFYQKVRKSRSILRYKTETRTRTVMVDC